MEQISATFTQLGLRSSKAVAAHILLENAYESNLVPDISNVDYLADNNGPTSLQKLESLSTFVDDLFVFGYLEEKEVVVSRGKTLCTSGKGGSAQIVVSRILCAVRDLVDGKHTPIAIIHTIPARTKIETSIIRSTIERIEKETDCCAKKNWQRQHTNPIHALFVAKMDVSEIDIQKLHDILPTLEERLQAQGYGIYSIDYTRDFSGTLDRKKLVEYLTQKQNFREKGTYTETILEEAPPTILDNTNSVGNHVCTWIETCDGYTMRTKVYNKIVSNFEAGEVREHFGGHLANYADCSNDRLRKTFLHPDVQSRGCTRIEISLYACTDRTPETADRLVDYTLKTVSPKSTHLFVEQPATKHWENLAKHLDRCFVLADRPNSTIYVCWYAHTKTGRLSGVRISPTKFTVDCDNRWNRAILWAMGDFGFRNCPIFHIEILSLENDIQLTNLQCYTKDSKTILCTSRKPTQLHPNAEDPSKLLPPAPTVEWEWRKKKCHAIGVEQPTCTLQEVPSIAANRKVSLLSTRKRAERQMYLLEEQTAEEWKHKAWNSLEKYQEEHIQNQERRNQELADMQKHVEQNRKDRCRSNHVYWTVEYSLENTRTEKISTLSGDQIWSVLGYRMPKDKGYCKVVVAEKEGGTPRTIWTNNGLRRVLEEIGSVEKKVDRYKRVTYWFPREYYKRFYPMGDDNRSKNNGWQTSEEGTRVGLDILVEPPLSFIPEGQSERVWYPIQIVDAPIPAELPSLRELALEKELEEKRPTARETMRKVPGTYLLKDCVKCIDLAQGQYICKEYTTFPKNLHGFSLYLAWL